VRFEYRSQYSTKVAHLLFVLSQSNFAILPISSYKIQSLLSVHTPVVRAHSLHFMLQPELPLDLSANFVTFLNHQLKQIQILPLFQDNWLLMCYLLNLEHLILTKAESLIS
jgi:hypothetical protein